eukprot:5841606-Prymnesium_polylepis.2
MQMQTSTMQPAGPYGDLEHQGGKQFVSSYDAVIRVSAAHSPPRRPTSGTAFAWLTILALPRR